METRRWINQSQPQTLYLATILLYISAALDLLFGRGFILFPLGLLMIVGRAAAGYGIANERRWGYFLGVGVVGLEVAFLGVVGIAGGLGTLVSFSFILQALWPVVLFVLLLHPLSREYQRIWFK